MKKTLTCLLAVATITVAMAATATDASAQWRGREGVAVGTEGDGRVADGDKVCRGRRRGRDRRRDHRIPAAGLRGVPRLRPAGVRTGCYWASEPVYDGLGRVAGYTGRPVQGLPRLRPRRRHRHRAMPDRHQRRRRLFSFRQNEAACLFYDLVDTGDAGWGFD